MKLGATAANVIWASGNVCAARRFSAALREPEAAQAAWLKARLKRDAESAFGREHEFGAMRDYADFSRRVPIRDWTEFAPWVSRIRAGEKYVLSAERVTHLAPTSGSSGGRKLIPFTAGLQTGFSEAVGAWMWDLARQRPGVLGGPAYWSVSPLEPDDEKPEVDAVRIGFADDAEYLGGARAWLARQVLAVPANVRHERDAEAFWRRTLIGMLAERELRLISIWHPSFGDLLLAAAERQWDAVCAGIADGRRAAELRKAGPGGWRAWWPRLQVISCWGEQAAEPGWRAWRERFPNVLVQAKGLLATEAAVTVPWHGEYPMAVGSHFFEFIDANGNVRRAHELGRGQSYEVVVTNGGGLWRYRLGDVVECTGRCAATPTLRFLGRAGNVSDLRGEKLDEVFVAEVLRTLWPEGSRPETAVLRARGETEAAGYVLETSREADAGLADRLDEALSRNPHYALARRLRQLAKAETLRVDGDLAEMARASGVRMGDEKPRVLIARQRK